MNVYPMYTLKHLIIRRIRGQRDWIETYYVKFSDGKYRRNYCLDPDSGALIMSISTEESDYISRKKAVEVINKQMDLYPDFSTEWADLKLLRNNIEQLACADVTQVRHGKWELDEDIAEYGDFIYTCSACGVYEVWGGDQKTNYCPNCGALMEQEM